MSKVKEFKEFVIRGNVVDMAVGIIIGAAFGKIVSSFVGDVVMPPIGVLMGGVDFSNLSIVVKEAVGNQPAVVISYGKFLLTILDFIVIASVIFVVLKTINSLKKKEAASPEVSSAPSKGEILLTEIRDLLKDKR